MEIQEEKPRLVGELVKGPENAYGEID